MPVAQSGCSCAQLLYAQSSPQPAGAPRGPLLWRSCSEAGSLLTNCVCHFFQHITYPGLCCRRLLTPSVWNLPGLSCVDWILSCYIPPPPCAARSAVQRLCACAACCSMVLSTPHKQLTCTVTHVFGLYVPCAQLRELPSHSNASCQAADCVSANTTHTCVVGRQTTPGGRS